jgi:hypothetical protein
MDGLFEGGTICPVLMKTNTGINNSSVISVMKNCHWTVLKHR